MVILLFISLFSLFFMLTARELPEIIKIKHFIKQYGLPAAAAVITMIITYMLFQTPLAGIPWGVLGWFLPGWFQERVYQRKHKRLKSMARDFVTSAAGIYAAGQLTPQVVRLMAERLPEPLAGEFTAMLQKRNMSPTASFPRMFDELGQKYGLSEFRAVASILAASERLGGPRAAARGLKRLGRALRQRDRLAVERSKATMEPKLAAVVVIVILAVGLVLDITVFRSMFQGMGKLVLAGASLFLVIIIFMLKFVASSQDLA